MCHMAVMDTFLFFLIVKHNQTETKCWSIHQYNLASGICEQNCTVDSQVLRTSIRNFIHILCSSVNIFNAFRPTTSRHAVYFVYFRYSGEYDDVAVDHRLCPAHGVRGERL